MRRSDWKVIARWALAFAAGVLCGEIIIACTRTFVPSGKPGCPNRSVWSDSAQRCIAREGR